MVLLNNRDSARKIAAQWIEEDEMWLRRTATNSRLRPCDETDGAQLFEFRQCPSARVGVFIRKAIGWALRGYSKWAPVAVLVFLRKHRNALSDLAIEKLQNT
ncbi:MAG: DNA alkylation repair protein [Bacteroidetes bacterium]|nr:DNA alkylation repair protein [Bacteroidota bacterium]